MVVRIEGQYRGKHRFLDALVYFCMYVTMYVLISVTIYPNFGGPKAPPMTLSSSSQPLKPQIHFLVSTTPSPETTSLCGPMSNPTRRRHGLHCRDGSGCWVSAYA